MLAACATVPPAPAPGAAAAPAGPLVPSNLVRNGGFEERDPARPCPMAWDCVAHNDSLAFRYTAESGATPGGGRSLCIERVKPEPWVVVRQVVRHERLLGSTLRLSMNVRRDGASGAGAGPWVLIEGPRLVNESVLVNGSAPWAPAVVEFTIPRDATSLIVGATLEGPGKACFDDVRLELR
jgi:hypothetical protein